MFWMCFCWSNNICQNGHQNLAKNLQKNHFDSNVSHFCFTRCVFIALTDSIHTCCRLIDHGTPFNIAWLKHNYCPSTSNNLLSPQKNQSKFHIKPELLQISFADSTFMSCLISLKFCTGNNRHTATGCVKYLNRISNTSNKFRTCISNYIHASEEVTIHPFLNSAAHKTEAEDRAWMSNSLRWKLGDENYHPCPNLCL